MSQLSPDEYNQAVGAVVAARQHYEDICAAQGPKTWAAQQAHEYLDRMIEHRQRMRDRHDAEPDSGR